MEMRMGRITLRQCQTSRIRTYNSTLWKHKKRNYLVLLFVVRQFQVIFIKSKCTT
uniref:Uncharacterized protein n=1 Tax=Lepeophtheirus salmonis TaxID=72036 RepID=A0A0K2TZS3_LEPSM